jgi:hypothetical protein
MRCGASRNAAKAVDAATNVSPTDQRAGGAQNVFKTWIEKSLSDSDYWAIHPPLMRHTKNKSKNPAFPGRKFPFGRFDYYLS